jgi:PAS domain S-box-containing protein
VTSPRIRRRSADPEQDRLERVLDTSPVAIVEMGIDGRMTYANRAAEEMLRLTSAQSMGAATTRRSGR